MTSKSERDRNLASAGVLPKLPSVYGRDPRDPKTNDMPSAMVGATIMAIGAIEGVINVEGGGLVIDYLPVGSKNLQRVVFGFTEMGMWIEYHSSDGGPAAEEL
jgi:hypothetical protein